MSNNTSTQRDMILLFGLGLVVGAAAGLLLAPSSGEETRRRIGSFVDDTTGKAREGFENVAGKAREGIEGAGGVVREQSQRLAHALKEGKEAFQEGLRKS